MKKGDKFKLTVFVFAVFTIVIFACVHSLSRKTWNIRKPCASMFIPAESSKLKAALSSKSGGLQVLLSSPLHVVQSEWEQVEAAKSLRFE